MSLYRQVGQRGAGPLVAVALAFALIGGLVGFLAGSAGEEEGASLEEAIEEIQDQVRPALSELELVTIEYGEAVQGGTVVAQSEYEASADHVERAREAVEAVAGDLRLLSPAELAEAERALDELSELVERRADPSQVNAAVERSDATIEAAARL